MTLIDSRHAGLQWVPAAPVPMPPDIGHTWNENK
jgi:hypothetical protein